MRKHVNEPASFTSEGRRKIPVAQERTRRPRSARERDGQSRRVMAAIGVFLAVSATFASRNLVEAGIEDPQNAARQKPAVPSAADSSATERLQTQLLPELREWAANAELQRNGRHDVFVARQTTFIRELQHIKVSLMRDLDREASRAATLRGGGPEARSGDAYALVVQRGMACQARIMRVLDRLIGCCRLLDSADDGKRQAAKRRIQHLTGGMPRPKHTPKLPHTSSPSRRNVPKADLDSQARDQSSHFPARRFPHSKDSVERPTLFNVASISGHPCRIASVSPLSRFVSHLTDGGKKTAAPSPMDLAATPPFTVRSDRVLGLARDLGTAARIFEFFRNEFVYEPYFGAVKGTAVTLDQRAGNDVDTACAMVSVLRAAGIPARFQYGTIRLQPGQAARWLGVAESEVAGLLRRGRIPFKRETVSGISSILVDHVWVKAYLNYLPYRGAMFVSVAADAQSPGADKMWIDIDPSFKQHVFAPSLGGRNLRQYLPLDSDAFFANIRGQAVLGPQLDAAPPQAAGSDGIPSDDNATALPQNYILNEVAAQATWLQQYMAQHELSTETVFRRREIDEERYGMVPCTDLYKIAGRASAWSQWPAELAFTVTVAVDSDTATLRYEAPLACLLGDPMVLTCQPASTEDRRVLENWQPETAATPFPAYWVQVQPVLCQGKNVLETASASVPLGKTLRVTYQFRPAGTDSAVFPGADPAWITTTSDRITAGSRSVLLYHAGQLTSTDVADARADIERSDASVDHLLQALGINYLYQSDRFAHLTAGLLGCAATREPSLLRISWDVDMQSLFGEPYQITGQRIASCPIRDAFAVAPIEHEKTDHAPPANALFTHLHALATSALSCNGLEQMLEAPASSAVRLLQAASRDAVPVMTLHASAESNPTVETRFFDAADTALTPACRQRIAGFVESGHHVTFAARPIAAGGLNRIPLIVADAMTGDTGLFAVESEAGSSLNSGGEVKMRHASLPMKDLVRLEASSVPSALLPSTTAWLRALPEASVTTGIAYLATIAHLRRFFSRSISPPASRSSELQLSALKHTAAAISLIGKMDEISKRPAIVDVQLSPPTFSTRTETVLAIRAGTNAAASWTVRISDEGGAHVADFSPADNRDDYAGRRDIVSLDWDGRDPQGTPLPDGLYQCHITARGNGEATLSRGFTIDSTQPDASINVVERTVRNRQELIFQGTANDRDLESYSLGIVEPVSGAKVSTLTEGNLPVIDSHFAVLRADALPNGTYQARLRVTDAAGNVATQLSDAFSVTESLPDLAGPTLRFEGPLFQTERDVVHSGTIPVRVTADDPSGVARIETVIDGEVVAASETGHRLGHEIDCTAISDGVHTLTVAAVDSAGNRRESQTVNFLTSAHARDVIAPELQIRAPLLNAAMQEPFAASATAVDNAQTARLSLLLDGTAVASSSLDTWPAEVERVIHPGDLAPGAHSLRVTTADSAGNTTSSAPIPFETSSTPTDSDAPTVTLAFPRISGALTGNVPVKVDAMDNQRVAILELLVDNQVIARRNYPEPAQLDYVLEAGSLSAGRHAIQARVHDGAGNIGESARIVFATDSSATDALPPTVRLLKPPPSSVWTGTVTVHAAAFDNAALADTTILLDGNEIARGDHQDAKTVTATIDTEIVGSGPHRLQAMCTDASGNDARTDVIPVVLQADAQAPDVLPPRCKVSVGHSVTLDSREAPRYRVIRTPFASSVNVNVRAADNIRVASTSLAVDGRILEHNATNPGTFTVELQPGELLDGVHLLEVTAVDAAGNTSEPLKIRFRFAADDSPPQVGMAQAPTPHTAVQGDVTLVAEVADNQAVSQVALWLDDELYAVKTSPAGNVVPFVIQAADMEDGEHSAQICAVDTRGNEARTPRVSFRSRNPIVGFTVSPSRLDAGESENTMVHVTAALQGESDWKLSVTGPTTPPPVTGRGRRVDHTFDASGWKDGPYRVALKVKGIDEEPHRPVEVNLVTGPPTAEIANLGSRETADATTERVRVTEGLLELRGTANDPDSEDAVAWRVSLLRPDGAPQAQLLPAFAPASSNRMPEWAERRVSDGSLGELDFTMIPNGFYTLRLSVKGGEDVSVAEVPVALDSSLKVGQFSFAQQDAVVPLTGMTVSLVRRYNSLQIDLDKQGDFGPGWTWALSEIEFNTDAEYQPATDEGGQTFSRRSGGGRNIVLTLPNGRRAMFLYRLQPGQFGYYARWQAAPGVRATLAPTCSNKLIVLPFSEPYWEAAGPQTAMEAFEFPAFTLTMRDGTRYLIERADTGAYTEFDSWTGQFNYVQTRGEAVLSRIERRNGTRVEFTENGVEHVTASGTRTPALAVERDDQGRIAAVYAGESLTSQGTPGSIASARYDYDLRGRLAKVHRLRDRSNPANPVYDTVEYRYNNPDQPYAITDIVDPRGITAMRTEDDENGRIIAAVDALGNRTEMDHAIAGRTETVYDRLGNPTTYLYDRRGNVTVTIDALGNRTTRTYDHRDNETSVTDPFGNTVHFTYDTDGNRNSVTDPLGNTTHYTYDAFGNQISVTDPLGHTTTNAYDEDGNLVSITNALGQTTRRTYDENGNLTASYNADGDLTASHTYDSAGNMTSTTDPNGFTRVFDYDANGRQTATGFTWVNPDDASDVRTLRREKAYNAAGSLIRIVDSAGNVSTTLYNAVGKAVQTTDKFGNTTRMTYDARGNVIQTSYPDGTVARTVYDAQGRTFVTQDRHVPGENADGARTVYDRTGRVVRSERLKNVDIAVGTDAAGSVKSFFNGSDGVLSWTSSTYDAAGRLTESRAVNGNVTRHEYDAAGRHTARTNALGNRTEYEYDAAGRLIAVTGSSGRKTEYQYDALGRRTVTVLPDGSETRVAYDALGHRTAVTDQAGITRNFQYDIQGKLVAVVLPEVEDPETGERTRPRYEYEYNRYGQLITIRDPKDHETTFTYDAFGRRIGRTLPMGQTENMAYNNLGQLVRKTDFNGQMTEFVYDRFGRISDRFLYESDAGSPQRRTRFIYDERGRQIFIIEGTGSTATPRPPDAVERITEKAYDQHGRLVRVSSPEGTVNYEYDQVTGRRVRTWTAHTDSRYRYDEFGRLGSVSVVKRHGSILPEPAVTTYAYNARGSRAAVLLPNDVMTTYTYDRRNHLTQLTHKDKTGTILSRYEYQLGPTGRRVCVTESVRETDNAFSETRITYTYDDLYRLTEEGYSSPDASEMNFSIAYTYDLSGNRRQKTRTATTPSPVSTRTTYHYDANDRLVKETAGSPSRNTTTYEYDANGSLVARTEKAGHGAPLESSTYQYNLENRLAAAHIERMEIDSSGVGRDLAITANYAYNEYGVRVRAASEIIVDHGAPFQRNRTFLIDGQNPTGYAQVLEESNPSGIERSYALGPSILSQTSQAPGETAYFLADGHGSTRQLADSEGAITNDSRYTAYGEPLHRSPGIVTPPPTPIAFAGEQYDPELQMGYNRARYYLTSTGTWNRMDPFSGRQADPQSLHKYTYCHADPVNALDPSGKMSLTEQLVVTPIVNSLAMQIIDATMPSYHAPASPGVLTGLHRELAYLSDDVYANSGSPPGWKRLGLSGLWGGLGINPNHLIMNGGMYGFYSAIYKHRSTNLYVLAFRGTQDLNDWWNNAVQGIGKTSEQYTRAMNLSTHVWDRITAKTSKLMATGHSLGGGLATIGALRAKFKAAVFNPAGLHPNSIPKQVNLSAANSLVTRYVVHGEMLDWLQGGSAGHILSSKGIEEHFFGLYMHALATGTGLIAPDSLGKRVDLIPNSQPTSIADRLNLHSIDSVLTASPP